MASGGAGMARAVAGRRRAALGDVVADLVEGALNQPVRHRVRCRRTCRLVGHDVAYGDQLRLRQQRINHLRGGMPVAVTGTLDGIYEGVEAWVI